MLGLSWPIKKIKIRKGIYAYKYANGPIEIEGEVYEFYTIKEAIKLWRYKHH